jgi:hypothetical protein
MYKETHCETASGFIWINKPLALSQKTKIKSSILNPDHYHV